MEQEFFKNGQERPKMSRENRAKQFAPFDALKGLQNALRLKEYEHERVQKGDIQEEKAAEISKTLLELEKGDSVSVTFFEDGHHKHATGTAKILFDENVIVVGAKKIPICDILDIVKNNNSKN